MAAVSGTGSMCFLGVVVWDRLFNRDLRVVYLTLPTGLLFSLLSTTYSFCALRERVRQLQALIRIARQSPEAAAEVAEAV